MIDETGGTSERAWAETRVSQVLGIRFPIVQGPFGGGLSSTKLTATVSNLGGLGSYGADGMWPEDIVGIIRDIRQMTSQPFAINLWMPKEGDATDSHLIQRSLDLVAPLYREVGIAPLKPSDMRFPVFADQIRALLDARPPAFSFVFGIPDGAILRECRDRGIATIGTATTIDEGVALDAAGVDCIVASGAEAGGHKGAFLEAPERSLVGTFALVPQLVDRVRAPVIAAGGIADRRGVIAALALGGEGVQVGTAFLACSESGANERQRALLLGKVRRTTQLTKAFTGRLARSMPNRLSILLDQHAGDLPGYPIQGFILKNLREEAIARGDIELIPLWTGQAAALIRHSSAVDLFRDLTANYADDR